MGVRAITLLKSLLDIIEGLLNNKAHKERIYLSPPDQTGVETAMLEEVLKSNWIAPVGPHLEQFEDLICEATGYQYAVALNSATAALHLSMLVHDIPKGVDVLSSTMTFCAVPNAIIYAGAKPVFIDSESKTWNIDLNLLEEYLQSCDQIPAALIVTHIYGMPTDMQRLEMICQKYEMALVHDLAEAIGAKFDGRKPGSFLGSGVVSFNGNKLITTGGGGAYLTNDRAQYQRAQYLATQAKSKEKFYFHESVGYNYRLSNVLAAIGIAQMVDFEAKVNKKRSIFERYKEALKNTPFVTFQEEPERYFSDRWLSCILIDPKRSDVSAKEIIDILEMENIECRQVWNPMHLQPVYQDYKIIGGAVSKQFFEQGVCLPSGTGMTKEDQKRVIAAIIQCFSKHPAYQ